MKGHELTMNPSTTSPSSSGAGYLFFLGILQILTGILSVLFSVFGIAWAGSAGALNVLNPESIADLTGSRGGAGATSLLAAYVSFQFSFGWIFGLFFIASGICCLRRKGRAFVWLSTILNVLNGPYGTTVSLLTWHGLYRDRLSPTLAKSSDKERREGSP